MNITGGKYNSRKIKAPETDRVRPTLSKIRSGVFNSLSAIMNFEDKSFLDLFSGSGIMSLEAVSRGFESVTSVEKDFKIAKIIKENFKALNIEPKLIVSDAIKALDNFDEVFDVVYIDPPYKMVELYNNSLKKIAENKLLNKDGIIIVECQKGNDKYDVPSSVTMLKEKLYGDTIIRFYK